MTFAADSLKKSPLFVALASEVHHRSLVGLLTVLVVLLHVLAIIWLLQPAERINETKTLKIVEVALLPKPEPKTEPKPKVVQPETPRKIPPKKKAGKPPVKEKAPVVHKQPVIPKPVVHKQIEHPKPQPVAHKQAEQPRPQPVLTRKPTTLPAPTTFSSTAKKWSPPTSAPSSSTSTSKYAAKKPSEKTGEGGHDNNSVSSGVVELVQAKPNYPMRAKSRHIEGWVKIAFTVTATGSVTNAHVVGASPAGIFDTSALDTIQKFKFKPKMVNGKAVNGDATKTFRFNLN